MSKKTTNTEAVVTEVKTAKRGRPTLENSARQARLAARAARLAAGGELRKGRPTNPESARQNRIAARVAAGGAIKRGRPALKKVEVAA